MKIENVGDLRIGDLGFSIIERFAGSAISAAQTACDVVDLLRGRRGESAAWFTHAYTVIDVGRYPNGDAWAEVLEAMPRGARIVRLHDTDRIGYGFGYTRLPYTAEQREAIRAARELAGTPYSFAEYVYLFLRHVGLPRALVGRYIESSKRMMCSQMADFIACHYAGFHMFKDGRISLDVMPGALWRKSGALGEAVWW